MAENESSSNFIHHTENEHILVNHRLYFHKPGVYFCCPLLICHVVVNPSVYLTFKTLEESDYQSHFVCPDS